MHKNLRLLLIAVIYFTVPLMAFVNSGKVKIGKVITKGNLIYLANTVVIKLKNVPISGLSKAANVTAQLNSEFKQFKFTSSRTVFSNQPGASSFGLNRIMFVKYSSNADPQIVANKIKKLSNIEWAEPKYVRSIAFTPNDSSYSSQYNLSLINAAGAWNISKGDATVVIGIVDTGVDWMHPDLYANIWHNPNWQNDTNFPGDSIGWDFGGLNGTPDNNPMEDKPFHGTAVAGAASAVTNNDVGIAGIGYNCKIMPVKAAEADITDASGDPYIVYGFEGIIYAVNHGAKVINCSWGGDGFSNYEQSVIDYAVSKGALVVAAAGNDNSSEDFYPASYNGVLAVAATDQNDLKASFSNYAANVSVSAPGVNIYSTWSTSSYAYVNGTSFSSPITAGLAGLVFSHFPSYTPEQVIQQIRVNSDNISSKNSQYQYLLGYGRIDAYKALADSNSDAVRATNVTFSDTAPGGNNNNIFEPGETISVKAEFMNYLKPISSLNVSLISLNSYSTIVNGTFAINNVATLDSFSNPASQFTFTISKSVPYDAKLNFILKYSNGSSYSDFQLISVNVNPSYITQSGNNIALTITSKGNLGFYDYPTNLEGQGFKYAGGPNLLFEGALITGNSSSHIADAARGSDQNYEDSSFYVLQHMALNIPGSIADQQTLGMFNDNNAGSTKLGITTKFRSYTYSGSPNQNFIILRYDFTNNSDSTIANYYAGLFLDWDMVEASGDSDYTAYDATGNLGYVYHEGGNPNTWVGTALISSNNYGYFGILNDGSDGGINIYDGFTPAEKWQTISNGIGKAQAGPGDISEVTSSGPYTIAPGQTINVGFAIAGGNNLDDLRTSIASARSVYQSIITDVNNKKAVVYSFNLSQNYPNPFNPTTIINYSLPKASNVKLTIYNLLGQIVATIVNSFKQAGKHSIQFSAANIASGVYIYTINAGNFFASRKMLLLK